MRGGLIFFLFFCLEIGFIAVNGQEECSQEDVLVQVYSPAEAQEHKAGTYKYWKQFNGRNAWKTDDDKFAIWYNNVAKQWWIGWKSVVGSKHGMRADNNQPCPYSRGNKWMFFDNPVGKTKKAGNNVLVSANFCAELYKNHLPDKGDGPGLVVDVADYDNFQGTNAPAGWDDAVSSFEIQPGCTLTGYENQNRNGRMFSHEEGSFDAPKDNTMSSWICTCA